MLRFHRKDEQQDGINGIGNDTPSEQSFLACSRTKISASESCIKWCISKTNRICVAPHKDRPTSIDEPAKKLRGKSLWKQ